MAALPRPQDDCPVAVGGVSDAERESKPATFGVRDASHRQTPWQTPQERLKHRRAALLVTRRASRVFVL